MPTQKDLGKNDGIDSDINNPEDVVSFETEENIPGSDEEKSDAQRVADGEFDIEEGEMFVAPESVYDPSKSEPEKKIDQESRPDEKSDKPEPEPKTPKPAEEEHPEKDTSETDAENKGETEDKDQKTDKKTDKKPPASAPDPIQKRINKAVKRQYEAERKAEQLEAQNTKLEKELQELKDSKAKSDLEGSKPDPDDFETDSEYHEALGRWSAKMELHENEVTKRSEAQKPESSESEENPKDPRQEILDIGPQTYPDFLEVVTPEIPISKEMFEAAVDSEAVIDILYYLGQNPDEAKSIFDLKSTSAITRAIGKIEAKFEVPEIYEQTPGQDNEFSEKSKNNQNPRRTDTESPPAPVKPLGGSGKVRKDPGNMSIAEYNESRGYTRDGMRKTRVPVA